MPALCEFEGASWLLFGPNVAPLVYFSHLPIMVISFLLGLYVLYQNRHGLAHWILFGMTAAFSGWVFFDSIFWATNRSDVILFAWSMDILVEPLVYMGGLYLLYVLLANQDAPKWSKGVALALYAPIVFLLPTIYTLSGFDIASCLATEGFIAQYYSYAIEFVFTLWAFGFALRHFLGAKDNEERKKTVFLLAGVILFFVSFAWGNITGSFTEDWALGQYGLFGMPVFISFLMYSIVRFKAFDITLLASIALVLVLIAMSFSLMFVDDVSVFRLIAFATFVFVLIVSIFLIRAILRDFQARKEIEKLARELGIANNQQESLIHFISHEVKGALGKCSGILSLIVEGDYGSVSPKMTDAVEHGLQHTREAADMVTTILLSANIKSGAIKFDKKNFSLKKAVEGILDSFKKDIQQKNLQVSFEASSGNEYAVYGDENMLTKHVVGNLIDNAIRYTLEGTITVRLEEKPGLIALSVKDSGVGLTEDDKERLFSAGGRGKDSVKVNVNSTGYGLYFARQLVEKHEGTIVAESEGRGKGSTFTVSLPRATM